MGQVVSTSCLTMPDLQMGPDNPCVGCGSKGWLNSLALWVSSGTTTRSIATAQGRVNLRLALYRRKLLATRCWPLRLARARVRLLAIIWNDERLMKRFKNQYKIAQIQVSIMRQSKWCPSVNSFKFKHMTTGRINQIDILNWTLYKHRVLVWYQLYQGRSTMLGP